MKEILRTKVRDLLNMKAGQEVLAKGWVRTKRGNKEIVFVALNDGSTIKNIQIVIDKNADTETILPKITTGACIGVRQSRRVRRKRTGCGNTRRRDYAIRPL